MLKKTKVNFTGSKYKQTIEKSYTVYSNSILSDIKNNV